MHREEVFAAWAPDDALWSPWAKPVLFAHMPEVVHASVPDDAPLIDCSWAPEADELKAIVLDIPGEEAVWHGVGLARRGYQPVPLFNCATGPRAVVPVERIMAALAAGAAALAAAPRASDAPPAFLLDANRLRGAARPSPGTFDNRWLTFPQDFPSVNRLLHHRVRGVVVAQPKDSAPQDDLAHVLLRWQEGGLPIESVALDVKRCAPMTVKRPSMFRALAYGALVGIGLRRSSAGGFGAVVPHPSSGG